MRTELVEIYSDATNAAVMRHPNRRFPGLLIEGDTLHNLSRMAARALARAEPGSDLREELVEMAEDLQARVRFYKSVLIEHGLELPFYESPEG